MAWDFTHLLAKPGGSQPPPSKTPVNTALNNGPRISHVCWQNLAEVSRDRAKGHAQLTSAGFCQQMCEFPSPCVHAVRAFLLLGDGFTAPSARFCQQMCEIPSPCFNAVFTGLLLGHSSLPPHSARGFVQSRALAFTRYVQVFCLGDGFTAPSARFCQQMCEIPGPCFNAVFTGFLLDHSSLPPDFASRFVKSLALVFTWSQQVFALCSYKV